MAIKSSKGKLKLPAPISDMEAECFRLQFRMLPIRMAHLEKLQQLPWIHKDPFDRLLVGQAQAEGLTIITVDENIPQYDVETYWHTQEGASHD